MECRVVVFASINDIHAHVGDAIGTGDQHRIHTGVQFFDSKGSIRVHAGGRDNSVRFEECHIQIADGDQVARSGIQQRQLSFKGSVIIQIQLLPGRILRVVERRRIVVPTVVSGIGFIEFTFCFGGIDRNAAQQTIEFLQVSRRSQCGVQLKFYANGDRNDGFVGGRIVAADDSHPK